MRGKAALRLSLLGLFLAFGATLTAFPASAQPCGSPAVAGSGTSCTITTPAALNATTADPGMFASGSGVITVSGAGTLTVNLTQQGAFGGRALAGGTIDLSSPFSIVSTLNTAAGTNNQRGLVSDGAGSTITVTGTGGTMTIGPTVNASNIVGALAQNGGAITYIGTIQTRGLNGTANHALWATTGGQIGFTGTASTTGSATHVVIAESGGTITIGSGSTISNTGGTTAAISHAVVARSSTGTTSTVTATNTTITAAGPGAAGVKAEAGGLITINGGSVTASGSGNALIPPAGALAVGGGDLILNGAAVAGTGQYGHGVSVREAGSTATITGGTVTSSGNRGIALEILDGGAATMNGTAISTPIIAPLGGMGVYVSGAGSSFEATNGSVTTLNATAFGVRALLGAEIELTGTSISTSGVDAAGIAASSSTVLATNVTIVTNGDNNAMGALSDGNSIVTLIGGSVTTHGNQVRQAAFPHALGARNPGGVLNTTDTVIATTGIRAMGGVADDGGVLTLTGNSITTQGLSSIGLYSITEQTGAQFAANLTGTDVTVETFGNLAHGATAQARNDISVPLALLTLNNATITTHGAGAQGLRAILGDYGTRPITGRGEAAVVANDTTVFTEGANAHGALARDNPASVTMNDTSVLTIGATAHGSVAEFGGHIIGNNATILATGSNAAALYTAGEPTAISLADYTDSTLTNVSGPTIGVGGNGTIALTRSIVSGSGQWLLVGTVDDFAPLASEPPVRGIDDPGVIPDDDPPPPPAEPPPLDAPPPLTVSPGLATITATNSLLIGSAQTLAGSVSNVSLIDTRWNMTGSSNLTTLLNDPSHIQFSPPTLDPTLLSSYMTLTVHDYIGDGGTLGLNTFLDTDGAPSDRLVIEDGGTATGFSGLVIDNTTGPGAQTFGDGILVIEAQGTAVTGAANFFLTHEVAAGPYRYDLFYQNLAQDDENWYLRSTLDCPPTGAPTVDDPCIPIIRPGPALALAEVGLMDLYGRNLIDTLHERKGEDSPARTGYLDPAPDKSPFWFRATGEVGVHQGDGLGIYGPLGPTYAFNLVALQGGADVYYDHAPDGSTDRAGVYGASGGARADVTHHIPTLGDSDGGHAILNAWSVGGYWTHYTPEGAYLDAVIQGTFYRLGFDSEQGVSGETNGAGIAASLEAGVPFEFAEDWIFEPQAQLIGQAFAIQPFNDGAADISFSHLGTVLGRIGFRLAHDWTVETFEGDTVPVSVWGRANLWHRFLGQPTTTFSSADGPVPFTADLRSTWLGLGVGADVAVSENIALYGAFNLESTFDGGTRALSVKFGAKGTF